MKPTLEKSGPGTAQVNLGGVITMGATVAAWSLAEYAGFAPPGSVWTAITGLVIYSSQYWHGPNK